MIKYIFLIIFLYSTLYSSSNSFRIAYAKPTKSDLGELLIWYIKPYPIDNLSVVDLSYGYKYYKPQVNDHISFDFEIRVGYSYYMEGGYQDNIHEVELYEKIYGNFDFFGNRMRLGWGWGASYSSNIILVEKIEAQENNDNNSKVMSFMDLTMDFSLGKIINIKSLDESYIGWGFKHRSGVFGLINNVKRGGSNYVQINFEQNF